MDEQKEMLVTPETRANVKAMIAAVKGLLPMSQIVGEMMDDDNIGGEPFTQEDTEDWKELAELTEELCLTFNP